MTVNKKLLADLEAAAVEYQQTTAAREAAIERAKALARRASDAGMTQRELATLFGVDRARTIRRWLGVAAD